MPVNQPPPKTREFDWVGPHAPNFFKPAASIYEQTPQLSHGVCRSPVGGTPLTAPIGELETKEGADGLNAG